MPHLVLLGDSIFDNAAYVPGEPDVIAQVRSALSSDWTATLVAVDGDVTAGVARQLERLPGDATHLAISAGGNDALGQSHVLSQPADSVGDVLRTMVTIQASFQRDYQQMLATVTRRELPAVVCTIYDSIPGMPRETLAALSFFNDVITREASRECIPVLDLRVLCRDEADYSAVSSIEPSAIGGAKIGGALARIFSTHDFLRRECVVFS